MKKTITIRMDVNRIFYQNVRMSCNQIDRAKAIQIRNIYNCNNKLLIITHPRTDFANRVNCLVTNQV